GYASALNIIANAGYYSAANPEAPVIIDANGNLFGTTSQGGTGNGGMLFEIAKTPQGYATTPTILASFNSSTGSTPNGARIIDADGNLFGTTAYEGPSGYGTVFELAKTPQGYAATPSILVSFNHTNGAWPNGALLADGNGNLFGTSSSGGSQN